MTPQDKRWHEIIKWLQESKVDYEQKLTQFVDNYEVEHAYAMGTLDLIDYLLEVVFDPAWQYEDDKGILNSKILEI
jgi:hypothetical protein